MLVMYDGDYMVHDVLESFPSPFFRADEFVSFPSPKQPITL